MLDLGVRLEKGDERDPWRRMPRLFTILRGLFGYSMMNHDGQTRKRIEYRLAHYCKTTRETHGPCTMARSRICLAAIEEKMQHCCHCEKGQEWPRSQAYITGLLRDDRHQAKLKATRTTRTVMIHGLAPALKQIPADE